MLASALDTTLIRLQCYEGLDVSQAVYEWNYPRQLLEIRMIEAASELDRSGRDARAVHRDVPDQAAAAAAPSSRHASAPPVLLIDEIDRADEEFEGYLLEFLSDFQVTDPGARHDPRRRAAGRRHHVEPHARSPRRAEAPLRL